MKQAFLKIITYGLALVLCCIILLQGFQLSTKQKSLITKNNYKTEVTANYLSFLTCESKNHESVFNWIIRNLKNCTENTNNSESENEEEETKEVETDELCNLDYPIQFAITTKEIAIKDFLATKLPLPYLFQSSPPPES